MYGARATLTWAWHRRWRQAELAAFKAARDAVCAVFPDLVRRVDVRDIGRPVDTRRICRTAAALMFEHADASPVNAAVVRHLSLLAVASVECCSAALRSGCSRL